MAPQIIHPVEPAAEQQHFHFNEDVHHQEEINHPPPLPPMPPPTIPLPPRPTQPPPSSNPFFELEDDIIEPSYAPPPIPSISPDDM